MELTQLVFKTETTELEKASQALGQLVKDFENFDKSAAKTAQTQLRLAKAAKAEADAVLAQNKANAVALKTSEAQEKAEARKAASIEKTTKAVKENVSILQRQTDIANFQAEGFSKGQASILATAKASGQLSDQLKRVLELQRTLMGTDPFDKSDLGVKSLSRALKEATEAQSFFSQGMNLSIDQARTLSRDLDRLAMRGKSAGKSFDDITKAQAEYTKNYNDLASQYNRIDEAEKAIIKQRKEVVTATNYLVDADRKMAAALNITNAQFDKAGTDLIVKYETALRKSGIAQDEVTRKLGAYRTQLAAVQAQEAKRSEQNLARALSPQLTDIGVSLYSGQAPLTVLLQQGGQIADLFRLSGVEAQNFGKAMKDAFTSMIPVMATVAKGMGQFVLGSIVDMGKAINGSIASVIGMTGAIDRLYMKASEMGPSKAAANWKLLGSVVSTITGVAIAGAIAGLAMLAKGLYNVIQQENELVKTLSLNTGAMGLMKDSANAYALALSGAAGTTGQFLQAIGEMAKTGKFTREEIALVSTAAVQMQDYFGVAIEDTVKSFAKLKDDPVKALFELASKTGMVTEETIKSVIEFQKQGETAKATAEAIKAMADVNSQQVELMKRDYTSFSLWLMELGKTIKQFFSEAFEDLWRGNSTDAIRRNIAEVDKQLERLTDSQGNANMFQGSYVEALRAQRRELEATLAVREVENAAVQETTRLQKQSTDLLQAQTALRSAAQKTFDEDRKKELSHEEFRKKFIEDQIKAQAGLDEALREKLKLDKDLEAVLGRQADAEFKKLHAAEARKAQNKEESFYARVMREATNNTIAAANATEELTKSELKLKQIQADPAFASLSNMRKQDIVNAYQGAIAKEKEAIATEKVTKAEEFRLQVLGKSEDIGRNYYDQIAALEKHAMAAGWSREQIEELTRAIFNATPTMQKYNKALEDIASAAFKYSQESLQTQAAIAAQNVDLDFRLSLLGKTEDQQRALTIEHERSVKITQVETELKKKLLEIENDINKAKAKGLSNPEDWAALTQAEIQARQDAAEKIRAINRETSVIYAEDMQKEFDRIRNGISDSIVTALFEGGKAGRKKLRDLIVNELKKPITVFINAIISSITGGSGLGGDLLGSLFGGGSGGGGNFFSGLNNAVSNGFSNAFNNFATGPIGRSLGLSNAGAGTGGLDAGGYVGSSGYNPAAAGANGLTDLGRTLSNSIGMLGNALAGYGISRAVSGGYQTGLGSTVDVLGGIASAFFGPIGGIISGLVNRLFGRKLKDFGIEGQFGGETGFEGRQFQFYQGGLLRSDKTKYSPLEEASRKAIGDAFIMIRSQIGTFADALGLSTDELKDFTTTMKVSTKGLSEEAAQAKIMEAINTASNELAQQVIGSFTRTYIDAPETPEGALFRRGTQVGGPEDQGYTLDPTTGKYYKDEYKASEFAKEGETAIETLTRLATSLITVNALFDTLGIELYDASLAGGDMASKLADLFGGLEKMTEQVNFYYQNFYSQEEKQAVLLRQLTKEFDKHNLKLPKTREEYRKLVEAQDLTTEEGRKMYQFLISLAPAFAEIAESAQDAASSLRESARSAVEEAFSLLERLVNAEIAKLNEQLNAQQTVVNRLQGIFDLLKNNVKELYRQVDSTFRMQASQGRSVIQQAIATGVIPDAAILTDAIGAVRAEIESTQFATRFESDRARLLLAAELLTLQDQTEAQLTTEERILQGIKDQVKYLEDLLANARRQLDAALGTNDGITSIDEALNRFLDALNKLLNIDKPTPMPKPAGTDSGAATFGPGSATPNKPKTPFKEAYSLGSAGTGYNYVTDEPTIHRLDTLATVYNQYNGTGDLEGLLTAIRGAGGSLEDLALLSGYYYNDWVAAANSAGVPKFAGGGLHSGGLRMVGENSPELEITGPARYMNAPQMYDMMTQGASSGNDALRQEVSLLRTELRANVQHTAKLVKAIDRVTVGTNEGDALRTSAVV